MIISEKTIERLSLYRRVLQQLRGEGKETIMSHELADLLHIKPAQVRRDIMHLGYSGIPNTGYKIRPLLDSIALCLDSPQPQSAVLVGVGHLGLALLANFSGRWRQLAIRAAFDKDPQKVGQTFHGCRCYAISELPKVINETKSDIGIIAIPGESAQQVCDLLISNGIRGILNFSPVRVKTPDFVFIEHVDLSATFEKVAFFARQKKQFEFEEKLSVEMDSENDQIPITT